MAAMGADEELISHLQDITFLRLSGDEKLRLKGEFAEILSVLAKLKDIDTDGINECSHPLENINSFREDSLIPSYDRKLILENAALKSGEMFIAPKTVD